MFMDGFGMRIQEKIFEVLLSQSIINYTKHILSFELTQFPKITQNWAIEIDI